MLKKESKKGGEGGRTNYSVVILMSRQNLLLNESIKPLVLKLSNITNSDSVKINFSSSGQSQIQYCLLYKFLICFRITLTFLKKYKYIHNISEATTKMAKEDKDEISNMWKFLLYNLHLDTGKAKILIA